MTFLRPQLAHLTDSRLLSFKNKKKSRPKNGTKAQLRVWFSMTGGYEIMARTELRNSMS